MDRNKIDAYIDSMKEEMLEDLKDLIRIDSEKGPALEGRPFGEGPARALAEGTRILEKNGMKVTNYDNYVIAGDYGPKDRELDILAHLDVVPVSDGWTVTKPFEPLIRDGRIYGRGSSDDKGPAIAAIYAVRAIRDLKLPLKKGVRILLGSDEECGSEDLKHYYSLEKEAPCTFSPDANWPVINIEKARLDLPFHADFDEEDGRSASSGAVITQIHAGSKVNVVPGKAEAEVRGIPEKDLRDLAEKAAGRTKAEYLISAGSGAGTEHIQVRGQTAHASTPEKGNNALTALLDLLSSLPLEDSRLSETIRALNRVFAHGVTDGSSQGIAMSDQESGSVTITLDILEYDGKRLEGAYDCRAPLCATDENLTEVLRKTLADAGVAMDEGKMKPAHHVPADTPFVKTLLETYEEYTGKKGEALSTGGGTYVHELERGVAFGCESADVDNHMHGDDEFMVIDMILLSAKIFAAAILKICG